MKTIHMTPQEFVKWFVENNYNGEPFDYVVTSSGRKIMLNEMTDDDANFVAQQFMLMSEKPGGQA